MASTAVVILLPKQKGTGSLYLPYTLTALSPQSAEIRRESRPQHLEELLKMDLDTDSIRSIKDIMIRMGISPHDCFERADH